MVLADTIV